MATKIQRNRIDFPFTNRLPFTADAQGRKNISESDKFWKAEIERMYKAIQEQQQNDFDKIADKLVELEDRIVALEP